MDNKENKNECMWMLMGSIHESNRVTQRFSAQKK